MVASGNSNNHKYASVSDVKSCFRKQKNTILISPYIHYSI